MAAEVGGVFINFVLTDFSGDVSACGLHRDSSTAAAHSSCPSASP